MQGLHKVRIVLVGMIVGIVCHGIAFADEEVRTLVISDFTDDSPMAGWRTESAEDHGRVRVDLADDRATRGEHAVRITFGTDQWRVARLDLAEREAQDWRGYDVLEFDMYVEGPAAIPYLRVVVEAGDDGGVGRSNLMDIPTGQWLKYRMPLRRTLGAGDEGIENVEASNVGALRLLAHPNYPFEGETTVHIDHVRLLDLSRQRVRQLKARARALLELEALDTEARAQLERTLTEAEGFAAELTAISADDGDERERVARGLSRLESTLPEMSDEAVSAMVDASVAEAVATVLDVGMVENDPVELAPLERASGDHAALDAELRAQETVGATVERALEEARLRTEIRRTFAEADFAIGTPDWPRAWKDDRYTGPVGRRVELAAARNEFEPFQVVLLATESDLENVRLEPTSLEGAGTISAEHIEIAPMGWRKLRGEPRWIADMLRPDITRFDVEAGGHQPVWVNVYVPEDAPAGEYEGTLTIRADGAQPEEVRIALTVWDFALPETATMPTATNASPARAGRENAEAFARLIIDRRWNPFQMYQWGDGQSVEWMRTLTDMGATLHNPLRISRHAASYEQGPDGRTRVSNKDVFFNKLDPIMEQIREEDPELMEHILIYGFDEPSVSQAEAMDDIYGDFKRRYDGVRTSFADLYGMWDRMPELPEHVDVWTVSRGTLTKDARDRLQDAGIEVWWWNLYSREDDPVGLRVQYWSTFKDGLDGMLFYNLDAGGTGERGRYERWPATSLWPATERVDGGILRMTEEQLPISTTTFEYWREGMEDLEYLYRLRDLRDAFEARLGDDATIAQRGLLREADRLLAVPGYITAGILDERATDIDEVVVETTGHTDDMNVILESRREVAHLILQIEEALAELE